MKATLLAVLGLVVSAGCGGSSPSAPTAPSAPTPPPAAGGTLILSGIVYSVDAAGRRPLAGATVEVTESEASWGGYGRPTSDAGGRYILGSLPARHYFARASRLGYDGSPVVNLGYLEESRTLNFELTATGSTAPLTIAAIDPNTGATGGGTAVKIAGTGFQSGTTVTFGGERVAAALSSSTTLYATTPLHAAATVDVVVTRLSGEIATLARAFTYAAPQSFNFNGTWEGYALAHPESVTRFKVLHSDMDMRFTIEDNVLTSLTCGGSAVTLASPTAVSNGEFSFVGTGVTLSGRIVSTDSAVGTIDTPPCPATRWAASRR